MAKKQQYLPIPQPGHDSQSKNNLSTLLPCLHVISACPPPPLLLYNNLPAHQSVLRSLGISFPFSCVSSHEWLHFSPPIGKEFALLGEGGAPQKGNGRNTLWLARPPGNRSKYGKTSTTWNIVYDPRNDKVLTWTNHRVGIYY
jgi:hypothetical protein